MRESGRKSVEAARPNGNLKAADSSAQHQKEASNAGSTDSKAQWDNTRALLRWGRGRRARLRPHHPTVSDRILSLLFGPAGFTCQIAFQLFGLEGQTSGTASLPRDSHVSPTPIST